MPFYQFLLPKFIEDCNRLLPQSGRFSEMHMHRAHVANNAFTRTVCKWFRRSNGHLTLKIWTPTDMSGKRCTKLFPKLHPKPKAVSELKFILEKTQENFPQNKSCPEYQKEVERVGKGWWTFWAFPINQKSVHSYGICTHTLSWMLSVRDSFW